jgi:hypothetical protein
VVGEELAQDAPVFRRLLLDVLCRRHGGKSNYNYNKYYIQFFPYFSVFANSELDS